MLTVNTPVDVLAAAATLTREQAHTLADITISGSHSPWRAASPRCTEEAQAAEIALRRSDPASTKALWTWQGQARAVTAAHGRYAVILAVTNTLLALAAAELVDTHADARGWSPDAYSRLTSAWTTAVGPVRACPPPTQPMLDLTYPDTSHDPAPGTGEGAPIVIACGRRKAATTRPAAQLYTGSLFTAAARAATATGRQWLILSARHGLIHPTTPIAPYQATLTSAADITALADLLTTQPHPGPVEAWVPARYLNALRTAGIPITATPLAGLGIGAQLAWLTAQARTTTN